MLWVLLGLVGAWSVVTTVLLLVLWRLGRRDW